MMQVPGCQKPPQQRFTPLLVTAYEFRPWSPLSATSGDNPAKAKLLDKTQKPTSTKGEFNVAHSKPINLTDVTFVIGHNHYFSPSSEFADYTAANLGTQGTRTILSNNLALDIEAEKRFGIFFIPWKKGDFKIHFGPEAPKQPHVKCK